jgi:hypothetical protein
VGKALVFLHKDAYIWKLIQVRFYNLHGIVRGVIIDDEDLAIIKGNILGKEGVEAQLADVLCPVVGADGDG